jgi:hypothetical protein
LPVDDSEYDGLSPATGCRNVKKFLLASAAPASSRMRLVTGELQFTWPRYEGIDFEAYDASGEASTWPSE